MLLVPRTRRHDRGKDRLVTEILLQIKNSVGPIFPTIYHRQYFTMSRKVFTAAHLFTVLVLLSSSMVYLSQACSGGGAGNDQANQDNNPKVTYDSDTDSLATQPRKVDGFRFRRYVVSASDDEATTTTMPALPTNKAIFNRLDLDQNEAISVIEWTVEGGSLKEFWALLMKHDDNGDETVSRLEFEGIPVRRVTNDA